MSKIAAALLGLLLACSALGQPAAETRPRFLIDSIRVTGLRYASERVIAGETRLQPGREYTEAELHAGAARAARLPFVVRIDLRLERGETRGAYQLLIDVVEAKPVFGGGVLRTGGDAEDEERSASIGGRLFAGRSGVLHAAATAGDDPGFDLGYTQYDLFGSGVFVAALFEYRELTYRGGSLPPPDSLDPPSTTDQITTQLIAGVPLGGNHALRASWTREPTVVRGGVGAFPAKPFSIEHITTTELAYLYDSTDDPLVPTRGLSVFGSAAMRRGPYVVFNPSARPALTYYERPSFALDLRKHWELAPRHSVFVSGSAKYAERDAEDFGAIGVLEERTATLNETEAQIGYAFAAFDDERARRFGDLRLEAGLGYQASELKVPRPYGAPPLRRSESEPAAFVGLVYRNPWAVFRLRFEVGE
ncbi:MAG TPA: hypothetical protein VGF28_19635 [Thermoanaerobaculia bacterium]